MLAIRADGASPQAAGRARPSPRGLGPQASRRRAKLRHSAEGGGLPRRRAGRPGRRPDGRAASSTLLRCRQLGARATWDVGRRPGGAATQALGATSKIAAEAARGTWPIVAAGRTCSRADVAMAAGATTHAQAAPAAAADDVAAAMAAAAAADSSPAAAAAAARTLAAAASAVTAQSTAATACATAASCHGLEHADEGVGADGPAAATAAVRPPCPSASTAASTIATAAASPHGRSAGLRGMVVRQQLRGGGHADQRPRGTALPPLAAVPRRLRRSPNRRCAAASGCRGSWPASSRQERPRAPRRAARPVGDRGRAQRRACTRSDPRGPRSSAQGRVPAIRLRLPARRSAHPPKQKEEC